MWKTIGLYSLKILAVVVIASGIIICLSQHYESKIKQKIKSEHGTVLKIQEVYGNNPFTFWERFANGKHSHAFKVEYKEGNQTYTGWCLLSPYRENWKLPTDK